MTLDTRPRPLNGSNKAVLDVARETLPAGPENVDELNAILNANEFISPLPVEIGELACTDKIQSLMETEQYTALTMSGFVKNGRFKATRRRYNVRYKSQKDILSPLLREVETDFREFTGIGTGEPLRLSDLSIRYGEGQYCMRELIPPNVHTDSTDVIYLGSTGAKTLFFPGRFANRQEGIEKATSGSITPFTFDGITRIIGTTLHAAPYIAKREPRFFFRVMLDQQG